MPKYLAVCAFALGVCAASPAFAQSATTNAEHNAAGAGGGGGGGAGAGTISNTIPPHQTAAPSAADKAARKDLENGPPARAAANAGAQ